MELIVMLLAGYLWYSSVQLRRRVEKLEERLGVQKDEKVVPPLYGEYSTPTPIVTTQQVQASVPVAHEIQHEDVVRDVPFQPYVESPEVPQATSVPSSVYVSSEPSAVDHFISWLRKDFLMKVGALFLLMGIGWFVSYAFMNNWIGPVGRISLGLLTGVGILVLGAWRIKSYEHQGAVFMVLGSGTVLLTVFAGRAMYDFFTPASALLLMFATVLFVALVSVKYRRNSLALAGLIIAGIAPYLTYSPVPLVIEQFMYLYVVVAGTLWVVYFTGWRNLTLTALIIVFLETVPFLGQSDDSAMVLMWVFLFVATFFIANIISIIRVQGMALSQAHLFTAFGTALFLVLWVSTVAGEEWQSLIFVAWTIVFSVGSYVVYMTTAERTPFYVYGSTAIALLGAATAAELSGAVLTIAYTLEVALLVIASLGLRFGQQVVNALSMLFVVPMVMSLTYMSSSAWETGVIHADFFVLVVMTLVFLILGLFMHERVRTGEENTGIRQLSIFFLITGVSYVFILTALVNMGLFPGTSPSVVSMRGAVLTMVYTFEVIALVMIARGLQFGTTAVTSLHLLLYIPFAMSFKHITSSAWNTGVIHADFFAIAILMSSLLVLGLMMYERSRHPQGTSGEHQLSVILMGTGVLYVFVLTALVNTGMFAYSEPSSLQSALLTIAYTFEIIVVILGARTLGIGREAVTSLHLLFVVPMIMSLFHLASPLWSTSVIHPDFFAIVILGLTLAIAGVVLHEESKESAYETGISGGVTLVAISLLYGLVLVWLISHALFSEDMGTMLSLTVYTIIGLFMFFGGKHREHREITTAGGILLGFVVGRLLLVDVWSMDLIGRIITFIVIGVLLVSTAFMGNVKRVVHTQVNE